MTAVEFSGAAEGMFALFLEFWASSPRRGDVGQIWTDVLVEYKDLVAGIIEEGGKSGEFKPVGAGQLVWAILAPYDGLAAYPTPLPDLDLVKISHSFVETLLSGLGAAASDE